MTIKLLLISDIDDTLKRTHRHSKTEMLKKGMRSRNFFVGMPELYRSFALGSLDEDSRERSARWGCIDRDAHRRVAYVTGAISKFQWFSSLFLIRSGFPIGPYMGRDEGPSFEFKMRAIESLIRDYSDHEIILVGDNGESDPAVFSAIKQLKIKTTIHSFVHVVYAHRPIQGHETFLSSLGLAAHFLNRGWISELDFSYVLKMVRSSIKEDPQKVLPSWVSPPKQNEIFPSLSDGVRKEQRQEYRLLTRYFQKNRSI